MKGFTLIEVMVAVAITAILTLGVSAATLGLTRSAEDSREHARREERRSRAAELIAQDWRGRTRLIVPAERPPAGTSVLALATTSDAFATGARAGSDIRWIASDRGLSRREGGRIMPLLDEPVILEAWTGQAWTREIRGAAKALRLTLAEPAESIVISR
ncbi:MAG TPA: prepilin-type N-terminal cleavage/methylation domain-containing protein [Planctomycetota bacterium]